MILKKTIIIDEPVCEICHSEMNNTYNDVFGFALYRYLSYFLLEKIKGSIETSPFYICKDCTEKYGHEIAEALYDIYEKKLTEIKIKRK